MDERKHIRWYEVIKVYQPAASTVMSGVARWVPVINRWDEDRSKVYALYARRAWDPTTEKAAERLKSNFDYRGEDLARFPLGAMLGLVRVVDCAIARQKNDVCTQADNLALAGQVIRRNDHYLWQIEVVERFEQPVWCWLFNQSQANPWRWSWQENTDDKRDVYGVPGGVYQPRLF